MNDSKMSVRRNNKYWPISEISVLRNLSEYILRRKRTVKKMSFLFFELVI